MDDYYETLGLNSSATEQEIRRAYRILARRYHPDVNPGKDTAQKFRSIAEAYEILSDRKRREKYDTEYDRARQKFQQARYKAYTERANEQFRAQSKAFANKQRAKQTQAKRAAKTETSRPAQPSTEKKKEQGTLGEKLRTAARNFVYKPLPNPLSKLKRGTRRGASPSSISIIEVSITVPDSIQGVRKTIEIREGESPRKLSVRIPAGAQTGSVVRMRNTENADEELVLVVQVAKHPFLSIEKKGLVVELPITVQEAMSGANVIVPTLEDQIVLKVPPGTQSGTYIRLPQKGINHSDDSRGDLYYKVSVRVPDGGDSERLRLQAQALGELYSGEVRANLPRSLLTE